MDQLDPDDSAPGDDGRPLGDLTAAIIAHVFDLAKERRLGPLTLLREAAGLAAEATLAIEAPERTKRDKERAAAIAAATVEQIAGMDVVDVGIAVMQALAPRRSRRD